MSDLASQANELRAISGELAPAPIPTSALINPSDELKQISADLAAPKASPSNAPVAAENSMPWYERMMKGVQDPFNATAQLLLHNPIGRGALRAGQYLASAGGTSPNPVSESIGGAGESLDTSIQQSEKAYQAKRGNDGVDWWRAAGNVANPINWIAPETGAAGAMATLGANALRGGITAALSSPVTDPNASFAEEKSKQLGVGALGGAILTPVAAAVGRVINPQISQPVKTLMKSGVTPTPGQILGGTANRVEDALTSVPFLGDFIKTAQGRALSDFNTAAYQRALNPIGEKAPAIIGREGVEAVANKLGDKYDALLPKLGFKPDAQFASDLSGLMSMAKQLPKSQADQFNKIVSTQLGKATPDGLMNGETLKGVTSTILQKAKGYSSDSSFDNRELGSALMELHSTISRALQRSNPEQAAQLHAIDTGWANYARIRQAAASQGAHDGIFTPAQLSAAVKALDKSVGKGNFAKGNALMQDLSDAGKSVLSQKVPDSGTPLRSLVGYGLGGGLGYLAGAHPLAAAGAIGGATLGSLPYTPFGQRAAAAVLTKRPDIAPELAKAIVRGVPALGGVSGAALLK